MEFDGDTDKYIYTAEVKTSLYILDKKVKRLVHIDSVFFLLFLWILRKKRKKKKQYLDISVENIRIEIVSFTDSNYMLI